MARPRISPKAWDPPPPPALTGPWERNATLSDLELLPLPGDGPEDVAIDAQGRIVTGLADGRICRLTPDGRRIDVVADTGGRPLGIEVAHDGALIVCDAHRGLLRVEPDRGTVDVLAGELGGRPLVFTNNAAIHPDGSILFSESSRRFGIDHFKADLLEHSCTGRLLRWRNGTVEVLLEGLAFANGVTLTHGGDAVLVAETGAYRITRLWLGGPRQGQTDLLADNLPGFPDNLSTGPRGTVWLALPATRDTRLDWLLPRPPALRQVVWALPDRLQPDASPIAFVAGLDPDDGSVRANLQGPGDAFHYVTGVREHQGQLYLGSLVERAVARFPLLPR